MVAVTRGPTRSKGAGLLGPTAAGTATGPYRHSALNQHLPGRKAGPCLEVGPRARARLAVKAAAGSGCHGPLPSPVAPAVQSWTPGGARRGGVGVEWAGRAGVHGREPRAEGRLHLQAGHVGTAEKPLGRHPSPGTQRRTGKARRVVAKLDTQPPATPPRRPGGRHRDEVRTRSLAQELGEHLRRASETTQQSIKPHAPKRRALLEKGKNLVSGTSVPSWGSRGRSVGTGLRTHNPKSAQPWAQWGLQSLGGKWAENEETRELQVSAEKQKL